MQNLVYVLYNIACNMNPVQMYFFNNLSTRQVYNQILTKGYQHTFELPIFC